MHHPHLCCALLALASSSLAHPATAKNFDELDKRQEGRYQAPVMPCASSLHVVASSGVGSANNGAYGLLGTLVTNITSLVAGSTSVTINYPKGDSDQSYAIDQGSANLREYIYNYHSSCPNTKMALVGYSGGAIMTMNTLCGSSEAPFTDSNPIGSQWTSTIIANVVYGDETYRGNMPWDYGSCSYVGRFPRTNTDACNPWASSLQNYCIYGDQQCCQGGAYYEPAHFAYPAYYDDSAANWVAGKYSDSQ